MSTDHDANVAEAMHAIKNEGWANQVDSADARAICWNLSSIVAALLALDETLRESGESR